MEFGRQWQGQTVGRFRLQQYLGGSENAAVFLTQLPATVASRAVIKLVRASGSEGDALLANWKRAAQLSHPHLMQVFDGGRCWLSGNELLYAVTEYADENLAQVIPSRALSLAETDAMLRPVLSALAYLHDQGLVHGHLRPSNVMAVGEQLKISGDSVCGSGVISRRVSPSEYDAPETAAGLLEPASDAWSLGTLLAESLTRQTPGKKSEGEAAKIPPPYSEIVWRCRIQDPAARWTVRDVAREIRLALPAAQTSKIAVAAKPTISTDADATENEAPRRARTSIALIVVLALVALVLAIVLTNKVMHRNPVPAQRAESSAATSAPPMVNAAKTAQAADSGGAVVRRVLPQPSAGALATIQGRIKVQVRLNVNAKGDVDDAEFISAGPSKYFSRLAMDAAKQWTFTPPSRGGQAVPSEWSLVFAYTQGGVQAFPEQVKSR